MKLKSFILFILLTIVAFGANFNIKDENSIVEFFEQFNTYIPNKSDNFWAMTINDKEGTVQKQITNNDLLYLKYLKNRIYHLDIFSKKISDKGFENIKFLENLEYLFLDATNFNNNCIKYILNLKKIKQLRLNNTKITGNALKDISKLKTLELLDVSGTAITDEDLFNLIGMDRLEFIEINNTKITDKGIKYLSKIESLKSIFMENTKVTDKGMDYLRNMKKLQYLELKGTDVTDKKIDELIDVICKRIIKDGVNCRIEKRMDEN